MSRAAPRLGAIVRAAVCASAVVTLVACSGAVSPTATASPPTGGATSSPVPSSSSTPLPSLSTPSITPAATTADAVITRIPDAQWKRIVATGAWHAGCPVARAGLRRVEVGYHGFDGQVHRGVLVVNADVASSVATIFTGLFDRGFPIHRMRPIEDYAGDDDASMAADNTSAFNCRRASQANAPSTASPHANGRAVDVNPYENPWIDPRCGCLRPDSRFGAHRSGAGVVVKGGTAWTVFTRAGWTWQDNATIDFQHFDTGYPSHPLA